MTEEEADSKFESVLQEAGRSHCPSCGRKIDRGDVAWNNASTDAGTGYSVIEIACLACGTEIAHWTSWWDGVDDWVEFVEELLPSWPFPPRSAGAAGGSA